MPESIRILHVLGRMDRGGTETLIMNLYRHIDRSKVQFDFLVHTNEKCDYDDEIHSLGGRIYSVPRLSTIMSYFPYTKALNSFFKNHPEYKIVHGHMSSVSAIALGIAKKFNVKVRIAHSHSSKTENGLKGFKRKLLMKRISPNATHLFACSELAAKWLFGKNASQSVIVKNAIDLDIFSFNNEKRINMRKQLGIDKNTFVVGHVGRFDKPKNHIAIINIFSELKKTKNNAVLLLVGNGELKPEIQRMVNKMNLQDSVKFLGVRSDVDNVMQAFDVFLFPSLYERLGIVLIEAQAEGIHCVTSDVIPKEADMGLGLIDTVNLKADLSKWVNKLLERRQATGEIKSTIKHNGYNINDTAEWIQRFYINEYNSHRG